MNDNNSTSAHEDPTLSSFQQTLLSFSRIIEKRAAENDARLALIKDQKERLEELLGSAHMQLLQELGANMQIKTDNHCSSIRSSVPFESGLAHIQTADDGFVIACRLRPRVRGGRDWVNTPSTDAVRLMGPEDVATALLGSWQNHLEHDNSPSGKERAAELQQKLAAIAASVPHRTNGDAPPGLMGKLARLIP